MTLQKDAEIQRASPRGKKNKRQKPTLEKWWRQTFVRYDGAITHIENFANEKKKAKQKAVGKETVILA